MRAACLNLLLAASTILSVPLAAQAHQHEGHGAPKKADSAYQAVQERGRKAMGVDQYTSTHVFDALADGGRIELQRDGDDPEGVKTIRLHLEDIARAFRAGDFTIPGFVHDGEVPGTKLMAARRGLITYTVRPLPRGAELRITTTDPEALAAIRAFMAFQRKEHRAGGRP